MPESPHVDPHGAEHAALVDDICRALIDSYRANVERAERAFMGDGPFRPTGILRGLSASHVVVDEVDAWPAPTLPSLPAAALSPLDALSPYRCPHRPDTGTRPAVRGGPRITDVRVVDLLQRHIAWPPGQRAAARADTADPVTAISQAVPDGILAETRAVEQWLTDLIGPVSPRPVSREQSHAAIIETARALGLRFEEGPVKFDNAPTSDGDVVRFTATRTLRLVRSTDGDQP